MTFAHEDFDKMKSAHKEEWVTALRSGKYQQATGMLRNKDNAMKSAHKEEWVTALRSGKYQQATGMLRNKDNAMCCLGVLCDITDPKRWRLDEGLNNILKDLSSDPNQSVTPWSYASLFLDDNNEEVSEDGEPPQDVRREVGLTIDSMHQLIKLNDEDKFNFGEIADFIEAYL